MLAVYACSDGSLHEWRNGGGVYIASTKNLTVIHNLPNSVGPIVSLSQSDSVQNVNVRIFGGADMINLRVSPMNLCIGVGTRFHLDSTVETLGHSLKYFVLVE